MKIVIDGLIGAGKSTQIELLSKHMKLRCLQRTN